MVACFIRKYKTFSQIILFYSQKLRFICKVACFIRKKTAFIRKLEIIHGFFQF